MKINTYLTFNGNCAEAFKFYEQCLRGKIAMMLTHADAPADTQVPEAWRNKVMHASLQIGDQVLMGSDAPPAMFEPMQGFSVSLAIDSAAEAERIYQALSPGGTVRMPLQQTFWAERFAMVVDRFGVPWMINYEGSAHV